MAAKRLPAKRTPAKNRSAKRPASKRPSPRLPVLDEAEMNAAQQALMQAIRSGPRGGSITPRGPFAVWLHAPEYGQLAQALGGFCRYQSSVPARLSEFAILCTARLWRAQFEWYAHAPVAAKHGVSAKTIDDLRVGRMPKSAAKDERAIYDFIQELYKKRRVGERNYQRVVSVLGEKATVELVGILGYYVLISMTLDVFNMLPPDTEKLAFAEPK
ncbi:MAG: carboxymuconolactone decarboxylase family protein [Pseudolabrys sp.]|jgi:4-carboxymuconolactone decarboxylase